MTVDQVLAQLRERGLRITPQRRSIVELLLEHEGHLTAQEVHDHLLPRFPDVSLDTVYRNLRLLSMLGLVCQSHLQTGQASRFALASGRDHHHHLICIDCGATEEFADCPMDSLVKAVTARHNFTPAGHALEIYGYCAACLEQEQTP